MITRCALTLIELLVVVAIIGVLAGLMLTSVNGIRGSARTLGCVGNLRTMGSVLSVYTSENDGRLPLGNNLNGTTWCDTLIATMGDEANAGVLKCPGARIPLGTRHYAAQFNLFAMASRIPVAPATTVGGWRAKPGRVSELRAAGVLLFDSQQFPNTGNASALPTEQEAMWDWYQDVADDRARLNTAAESTDVGNPRRARYRHPGTRCSFLYGDMHAGAKAWREMTRGDFRCRKNGRKQQWEPN